jgi:cell division protein FtsI (penicillin-binding protein 3)
MTRIPLRPLARILDARERGENPLAIERENRRLRHEEMRDQARARAESRLVVLAVMFFCAFSIVGVRMGTLAASEPAEPRAEAPGSAIIATRADIVDRHGRVLAKNMETHSLYAHPHQMVDPVRAAVQLAQLFPDLDAGRLTRDFTSEKRFVWVKRKLSPEQMQAVHDLGEPGLLFGPREMRLYPGGALAAHVLGGAGFGVEGVGAAEIVGRAGVEKYFDKTLRDPARGGAPLELALDLTVQAATEAVLDAGMRLMNAKGAAAVLMDVYSGEIISLASLPDFDPNARPLPIEGQYAGDSVLFNRAVQGVYELGSVYKIFAAAQALDLGLAEPSTVIDTSPPMNVGGHRIGEFENKNYGPLSVSDIIVKSSNRGTAKLALSIGAERQQDFLRALGQFDPVGIETVEAAGARPLVPKRWTDLTSVTVSYGHGISTSPLHLAAAYATIANGGYSVTPTLLKQEEARPGPRVMSAEAAKAAQDMLRGVVEQGTASMGQVEGYPVAGKTGTADKPRPQGGGYYEDKVIATFAAMFPADAPRYVLVVTLDEPVETSGPEPRRTAGWTAVPVAAEIIARAAPLLGLRPVHVARPVALSVAAN